MVSIVTVGTQKGVVGPRARVHRVQTSATFFTGEAYLVENPIVGNYFFGFKHFTPASWTSVFIPFLGFD